MGTPRPLPAIAAALLLALAFLRPIAAQQAVFRAGIDLVNLGVTVTDRQGQLVGDLTQDDFVILEDGRPQTTRYFATGTGAATDLHLGLLLDVSESMSDDIRFTRTAAIRFLNTMDEARDVTLVDFDTEVRAARFSQAEFPRLVERIRSQKVTGATALFDAIGVYLDGAAEQDGRTVMLLYTDGGDTQSAMRLRDVMELVKASDVTIYAIGVTPVSSLRLRGEQQAVMRQIAETSGGQVYFPASIKELDKVYTQVATEVRTRYTLGYVSTNERPDGQWRKVEIKVTRADAKDLRIRARKGYYAPFKPAP